MLSSIGSGLATALSRASKNSQHYQIIARASFATKTGTVKWFDVRKGFGFIIPEDGSDEVFVHQSAIHAEGFRSLAEGEPVEYTTMTDPQGRSKAERVTGPDGAHVQGAPRRTFDSGFGGFGRDGGGSGFGGGGFGGGGYGGGGGGFGGGFQGDSFGGGGDNMSAGFGEVPDQSPASDEYVGEGDKTEYSFSADDKAEDNTTTPEEKKE